VNDKGHNSFFQYNKIINWKRKRIGFVSPVP
jgi:hypothetical protein